MSARDVLAALAQPPDAVGASVVALPESQWFDRRSARIAPKDLADLLVAFANAEGGIVAIGVSSGKVEGTDERTEDIHNGWRQAGVDFVVPPVRIRTHMVPCVNHRGTADHLVILEVEPGLVVHATVRDEVLLRIGDESRRLSFNQRLELVYEKGQASFEASPLPESSVEDLDRDLVRAYAERLEHPDPERLLRARGLLTRSGTVTVAGDLIFGREPQVRFPVALVRVLRYQGETRGSGAGQQLVRDVRCEGPIPRMLEQARLLVDDLLPKRRALAPSGRFEHVGMVPRDAWLEGLVNAVVHRSYSAAGDHIRVDIFDDRIEIESPGRFPGLVSLAHPLSIDRFARNPRIARVCSDLALGQELGEGIRRIYGEMRRAGLVEPSYVQTAGSVRLRLVSEPIDTAIAERLPLSARAVLGVMRSAGSASTGDLMSQTGLARPTVLAALRALGEAGVIEWRGKSPKDPRATWCLRGR